MQSAESNQTVETLLALAYPHGEAPEFITPECRQEFSDIAATARKEHEKRINWRDQMHAAFTRRENEAAAAVLTIDELMKLDADALVLRWNARAALVEACSWLCDEIEAAEKAVEVLEAQYKAAEDLACLASMPEGTTAEEMYRRRADQSAEFEAREREHREQAKAAEAAELERINAMTIEELLKALFSNPWPYMVSALVHGQKEGFFNRSNFDETAETLTRYFAQHTMWPKRRMLERLWERYETVALGEVHKRYPTPRQSFASALGAR